MSEKTDNAGRYRFRLPPGETFFYISGSIPGYSEHADDFSGRSPLVIPDGVRTFTVPTMKLRPVAEGDAGKTK